MVTIDLTEKDAATLIEVLQSGLEDLRTERVATDNRAFHASLVERERFVADLIKRLETTAP